ncbi:hypothetical protein 4L372X_012 [Aeromonas phage 4_L372X]|nr:hypothetical protein 4L372X_012 [Aeromonas phage 4_L372X]
MTFPIVIPAGDEAFEFGAVLYESHAEISDGFGLITTVNFETSEVKLEMKK